MSTQSRAVWGSGAVLIAVFGASCAPDIPRDEPGQFVVAQFDPSAVVPVVPTPNDLALNAETGLVELDDSPTATAAEKEFNKYLRTLDGFPTAATATATFDGELDPATVTPEHVRVFDATEATATEITPSEVKWDAANRAITVKAPFERARTYVIALVGGDNGLRGATGLRVVGSPTFVIARASKTLVTCADLSSPDCKPVTPLITGSDADDTREKAVALERYRRELQPALQFLENAGIPRDQLAGAWAFSTVKMALATFDPAKKVVPFPNDLLMQNGKVNLPADPADDAQTVALKAQLNQLDGFSTTAALLTESGATTGAANDRLDAESLGSTQFVLVNLANPSETVGVDVVCKSCGKAGTQPGSEPDQLRLIPQRPLRSHTQYAAYWLRGAKGLSNPKLANTGSVFALMRISTPLVVNGVSQVPGVDVLTASLIEPLRAQYQPLFQLTDAKGVAREDILLAWSFTTQTTTEPLAELRNKPQEWNLPTATVGTMNAVDYSALNQLLLFGQDFVTSIRWMKEGQFTSGLALAPGFDVDPTTGQSVPTDGAFSDATLATPKQETLYFLMSVPKTAKDTVTGKIPVIIFQHGLSRSRRDAALIANAINIAGYAMISIDAPFHGARVYCHVDADCAQGTTCSADHRCPGGGLNPDQTGTPSNSGDGFVSATNPFATRDHFRQQVIDLAQLVRSIQDTTAGIGAVDVDDPNTTVVEHLDPDNIRYIGQSLGGIIGTLATAAIPEITASTLNVPGADPVGITLTSPAFSGNKQALDTYLAGKGIVTDSQAYDQFMDTARWVLDPADPQNFGRHLIAEPLKDVRTNQPGPSKRVFVSWTTGDQVVPNPTTQLLLRSIDTGNKLSNFSQKQYAGGDHSFLLNLFGSNAKAAQTDAVNWVKP